MDKILIGPAELGKWVAGLGRIGPSKFDPNRSCVLADERISMLTAHVVHHMGVQLRDQDVGKVLQRVVMTQFTSVTTVLAVMPLISWSSLQVSTVQGKNAQAEYRTSWWFWGESLSFCEALILANAHATARTNA